MSGPERVFVALGSNLGDRAALLAGAVERLRALPGVEVVGQGPVVETPALLPKDDPTPQPPYLNSVVELRSALEPEALLAALKGIERALGRTDGRRWAARPIDLDIVLWGERRIAPPPLEVPHPGLALREFVLRPLAALAPEVRHPVSGKTVRALLGELERGMDPSTRRGVGAT